MQRNLQDAIETLAMYRDMSEFAFDEEEVPWLYRVEDIAPLERLVEVVKSLASLAQRGNDLVAIGEACSAIENILESQIIDVNVCLTVGPENHGSDFSGGAFAGIRINANEITLDVLHTTYSSDLGSDHFTTTYALLKPGGGFDESGIADWINQLEVLRSSDEAKLVVERDHI
jgi:hypothetical protein